MKHTAGKRILCMLLLAAILSGCAAENESVLQNGSTTPTSASVSPTQATGTECTNPDEVTKATDAAEPTDPTSPTDPTEPAPTGNTQTEPEPTEPKPTEPKPTEPKPTEPKPTEPKPTEPKPTEPTPTEPKPTEPEPTEQTCAHEWGRIEPITIAPTCQKEGSRTWTCWKCGATDTDVLEIVPHSMVRVEDKAPTTESEGYIKYECGFGCGLTDTEILPKLAEEIDTAALEAYGNQYGVDEWGFAIDLEMGLHGDPVGYFPPAYVQITSMKYGREVVQGKVDALAEMLIYMEGAIWGYLEDGNEWHARLRVGVKLWDAAQGIYEITAYYG